MKNTKQLVDVYFQKTDDQLSGNGKFIVENFGKKILAAMFAIIKEDHHKIISQYISINGIELLEFESNFESKVIELYGVELSKQQYKEAIALGTEVLLDAVIYGMSHEKSLDESIDFILLARRIIQKE